MFQLLEFAELPSTNDYLKETYQTHPNRTVVLARQQTKGRGRFARVWQSNQDLTFSILFLQEPISYFAIPLAMVQTLRQHGIESAIKWPNDLLVEGKKVCGILIETMYEGNEPVACIVGIGVNLTPKQGELKEKAGYVPLPYKAFLQDFLKTVERLLETPEKELLKEYRRYHLLKGRKIRLDDVLWEVQDVQQDGTLCVSDGTHTRILHGEEVSLESIYEECCV